MKKSPLADPPVAAIEVRRVTRSHGAVRTLGGISLFKPLLHRIHAPRFGFPRFPDVHPGWSLATLSVLANTLSGACFAMPRSCCRLRK